MASNMNIRTHAAVLSVFSFGFCALAHGAEKAASAPAPFSSTYVYFEQNATEGMFEVVFTATTEKDGLDELTVRSPDGRPVVTYKAPDASLGMRQFIFETRELPDLNALRVAYPEGVYVFSGKTFSGTKLAGKATLSHRLAPVATFATPVREAENVPVKNFVVSWSAVKDAASYIVKVDQAELNLDYVVSGLPASVTAYALPDGVLSRGKEYKVTIGTVTRDGNTSHVETTFKTEK